MHLFLAPQAIDGWSTFGCTYSIVSGLIGKNLVECLIYLKNQLHPSPLTIKLSVASRLSVFSALTNGASRINVESFSTLMVPCNLISDPALNVPEIGEDPVPRIMMSMQKPIFKMKGIAGVPNVRTRLKIAVSLALKILSIEAT